MWAARGLCLPPTYRRRRGNHPARATASDRVCARARAGEGRAALAAPRAGAERGSAATAAAERRGLEE